MTITTELAQRMREAMTRKVRNWGDAVMRTCDFCDHHEMTVIEDGSAICASCCDAEYAGAMRIALEEATDALAAKDKQIAVLKKAHAHDEAAISVLNDRIAELEARPEQQPVVQPVMFIDGDISPHDADKLAKIIRELNDDDERPLAKMARTIRENPHPTNEWDMPLREQPSTPAAQPVTVKLPERYELQETSRNPYQSYMQMEPDAYGDWLKRDDVLSMLAGVGITIAEGE